MKKTSYCNKVILRNLGKLVQNILFICKKWLHINSRRYRQNGPEPFSECPGFPNVNKIFHIWIPMHVFCICKI